MRTLDPLVLLPIALLLAACPGSGEIGERVSGHIVGEDEQGLGPGIVLIEKGPVHAGSYTQCTTIDESGRWSVDLWHGPGLYGLHLFTEWNGYQYLPVEIDVEPNQQIILTNMMIAWGLWMDLSGQHSWPTQPDDATLTLMPLDEDQSDNPTMHSRAIEYLDAGTISITMDVSDPTDDLSRMQLACNTATGVGMALNPPSPPDAEGNYPEGTYQASALLDLDCEPEDDEDEGICDVPGESLWYFIVSDNMCNDTDVLSLVLPEQP
jgi:hypothetical protein